MDELTVRPYQPGDAEALTELMNLLEAEFGGNPGYTPEYVKSLTRLTRDITTGSRLVFSQTGELLASGLVLPPPDDGTHIDLLGGVRPSRRSEGLGRALFTWQLVRAKEIHSSTAPDRAWQAHAAAALDSAPSIALFRHAGMAPLRYFLEMAAVTSEAPLLPVPDGLTVRAVTGADRARLYEAHMEAFADHWGYQRRELDEWADYSVDSPVFRRDLSLIALDGEEIAGYVLGYAHADPKRLYVGQVGTRRPWRRRGLARALLAQVMHDADAAGITTVELGVDADNPTGAVGLYERIGFTVEARYVTYSRDLQPDAQ